MCEKLCELVDSYDLDVEYTHMNNGCGDDNSSAKLTHGDNESPVHADRCKSGR